VNKKPTIRKWLFALLLSVPIFFLYALHFNYHDATYKPTGFIQWEHALYMISAKEYKTDNAVFLYQYPLDDNTQSPRAFFQPQIFILGYLWKWLNIDPGILLTLFGLLFTLLTFKTVIEIIEKIIPCSKYRQLITVLFSWGGGLLSLCGLLLHFLYFKGNGSIADHIFFLDPGNGGWCLNFGRSLIYPLEAYYHFLFVLSVLSILNNKFVLAALTMFILTISHPYSSSELIAILFLWVLAEYFYIKSGIIIKKQLLLMAAVVLFHILYYGVLLKQIPVYQTISRHVALDWGYKAWHFIPAYCIVWLLSFIAIRNIPLLKKQFSSPINRLFFWWGSMAFILSVHGFAINPIQPLHFTRGYVYAGFFLFSIPAIQSVLEYLNRKHSSILKFATALAIIIFLSDNISWFYFAASKNNTGILLNKNEQSLIGFFKGKNEKGWVISPEKNYALTSYIQLYSAMKGWIPHPFLTFNIDYKRAALNDLVTDSKIDSNWKNTTAYFYINKSDTGFSRHVFQFPLKFENESFKVFQIN
jgi:hypothetical protein